MWIERKLGSKLKKSVNSRPVVFLSGARQTGKSSLLKKEFPNAEYVSFDRLIHVKQATESPEYFLKNFEKQTILDEIQYVPNLFRELKVIVDNDRNHYGKWLLSGSQQFELSKNISESLAGRISILHLETLSAEEIRNNGSLKLENYLWLGGYPELWSNKHLNFVEFFESYMKTYVERDLRLVVDIKNLNDFRRFFLILATRAGQLLNYRDISKELGVSDITVKNWLTALQISGLIYLLPPFYENIGKRLTKTPKLYFADHGLLCHLLNITTVEAWHNHFFKGALWENLVMMELVKSYGVTPGRELFFYRDQNGVEIDFIVSRGEKLFLIEAKAAEHYGSMKLNFSKVAPLFNAKYKVECILAQNIMEPEVFRFKEYSAFNPIYCRHQALES
ncbi:MAG: ATP-binding protein [bacterium]